MAEGRAPTEAYSVGMKATLTKSITPEMVLAFADLTGDHNPVHIDAEYAAGTRFKRPIAHGPLIGGFIGALVATELPGPGSIYVRQEVRYLAPVFVGDQISVTVEIHEIIDKHRIGIKCQCLTGSTVAVDGEIVVYL